MMHWMWTGDTRVEVLAFLSTSSAHFFLTSLFIYLFSLLSPPPSLGVRERRSRRERNLTYFPLSTSRPPLYPPLLPIFPLPQVGTQGGAPGRGGCHWGEEIGIGGVAAGKKLPNIFSSPFGCCPNDAPLAPQQEEEEGALGRRKRRVGGSRGHR